MVARFMWRMAVMIISGIRGAGSGRAKSPGLLPEPGTFLTGESHVNPLVSVFAWLMASVLGGIWFAWVLELNGLLSSDIAV
ncbi:hypothetical protein DQC40_08655 [Salmonella enterica subsp. enterica serovar Coeln]|nr:hypothetical protein [Salmonella enterica subsp. enterica serovar Coeln]